ncbi:transferrin-binding protein-like solute binding protein [Paracoccus pacificus]|uniref:Transferrin-binding protein-like solute binding protein n=1 Tax=Paracoccus pacificus TaxID=1463598 RepID=A0ABW4RA56_9RHOB
MIRATSILAIMVITGLSACGGSSGGGSSNTPSRSFAELRSDADRLDRKLGSMKETQARNMPTSGTATYKGIGAVALENANGSETEGIGEARLSANFANSTVAGRISQIKGDPRKANISGNIDLNGRIIGPKVGGRTTGQLVVNGESFTTNTDMVGSFGGKKAGAFAALGDGTAVSGSRRLPVSVVVLTEKQ